MKIWSVVVAVALVAVAAFVAMHFMTPPPAELDLSREKPSARGTYVVSVEPEGDSVPQGALHAWIATVATPQGEPVTDARIAVDGGMPSHGHGLPTAPGATGHLGEGRYRIEGVRFNMGGHWVLDLAISASPGDDDVSFNLML